MYPFWCYWNYACTTCSDGTFQWISSCFWHEKIGMYGTRCEYDKWSIWWCYVVEMNYCASMLLYEFKILSSNFNMAWLYNCSAISWHHPIITCCNFVDESHSRRGRYQLWGWWWSPTTTVPHASENDGPALGDQHSMRDRATLLPWNIGSPWVGPSSLLA